MSSDKDHSNSPDLAIGSRKRKSYRPKSRDELRIDPQWQTATTVQPTVNDPPPPPTNNVPPVNESAHTQQPEVIVVQTIAAQNVQPQILKPRKKYNVEVDPRRYRSFVDPTEMTRFACSLCGNVYKWRKSLNKHWKEKHKNQSPPPLDAEVIIREKNISETTRRRLAPQPQSKQSPEVEGNLSGIQQPASDLLHTWTASSAFAQLTAPQGDMANLTQPSISNQPTMANHQHCTTIPITSFQINTAAIQSNMKVHNAPNSGTDNSAEVAQISTSPVLIDTVPQPTPTGNQKTYICGVCGLPFVGAVDRVTEHFQANHMEVLMREITDKAPPRNTKVAEQNEKQNLSDPSNPLKCAQCDFIGRWPTELQKHAASHSSLRPFKCLVCSSTYKWRWDLAKHFDRGHPNMINPYKKRGRAGPRNPTDGGAVKRPRMTSPVPPATPLIAQAPTTPQIDGPLYPIVITDPALEPPTVDHSLLANYLANILSTMLHSHSELLIPQSALPIYTQVPTNSQTYSNGNRSFTCKYCDFTAISCTQLNKHQRRFHAKNKAFHCSDCDYNSNWKWDCSKHINRQHSDNPNAAFIELPENILYEDVTDEEFITSVKVSCFINPLDPNDTGLRTRINSILEMQKSASINCANCPFATHSETEMQKHLVVHKPGMVYRCGSCDYECKWKEHMRMHMNENHPGSCTIKKISEPNREDHEIESQLEDEDEPHFIRLDGSSNGLTLREMEQAQSTSGYESNGMCLKEQSMSFVHPDRMAGIEPENLRTLAINLFQGGGSIHCAEDNLEEQTDEEESDQSDDESCTVDCSSSKEEKQDEGSRHLSEKLEDIDEMLLEEICLDVDGQNQSVKGSPKAASIKCDQNSCEEDESDSTSSTLSSNHETNSEYDEDLTDIEYSTCSGEDGESSSEQISVGSNIHPYIYEDDQHLLAAIEANIKGQSECEMAGRSSEDNQHNEQRELSSRSEVNSARGQSSNQGSYSSACSHKSGSNHMENSEYQGDKSTTYIGKEDELGHDLSDGYDDDECKQIEERYSHDTNEGISDEGQTENIEKSPAAISVVEQGDYESGSDWSKVEFSSGSEDQL
ncbi:hypothetical protein ACOME3_005769 [Neoechinorhynchus agilis]